MLKNLCLVTALLAITAGCHSNPYAGVNGRLLPNPIQQKPGTQGVFTIDAPALVDVIETQTMTATVTGTVDAGTPNLDFTLNGAALPSWIDYNNGTMTFKPQVGDGTDPGDPQATAREYQINVTLTSSVNPLSKASHTIVVVVHKMPAGPTGPTGPGGITVAYADTSLQINEGASYTGTIKVTSTTSPSGPFNVSVTNLPPGLSITSTSDPTVFTVKYTPNYAAVTYANHYTMCTDANFYQRMCSSVSWTLVVSDPRSGGQQQVQVRWDVLDIRQDAALVSGAQLKATANNVAEFDVYVSDPNGEVAPQVTAQQPNFGSQGTIIATVSATGPSTPTPGIPPYVLVHIVWSGAPNSFRGTTQPLSLVACVYDDSGFYGQCSNKTINVQF